MLAGIVILMMHSGMDAKTVQDLLRGGAFPIHSELRISYNMLVNMLRLEDASPEDLIRSSFKQYLSEQSAPRLEAELREKKAQYDAVAIEDELHVQQYYEAMKLRRKLEVYLQKKQHVFPLP